MATRTESEPAHLLRWLMAPAAIGAVLMSVWAALRRRAAEPSLPRMSDEWLRSHGANSWDRWR